MIKFIQRVMYIRKLRKLRKLIKLATKLGAPLDRNAENTYALAVALSEAYKAHRAGLEWLARN